LEVMIANNRIADLIRENKPEEIPEAIADGEFFHMQTLTAALIDLVIRGEVERETAANASPNRHDFEIALRYALKEKDAADRAPDPDDVDAEEPRLRLAHEPERLGRS